MRYTEKEYYKIVKKVEEEFADVISTYFPSLSNDASFIVWGIGSRIRKVLHEKGEVDYESYFGDPY